MEEPICFQTRSDGPPLSAGLETHAISPIQLEPDQPFVFPAKQSQQHASDALPYWQFPSTSNGSFTSMATETKTMATPARKRQRPSVTALPTFSFNPAESMPQPTSSNASSPPQSPNPLTPTSPQLSARYVGHRRAPSEFIGGDGKNGNGLMSTSPIKGENAGPSYLASKSPLPPSRRGHAHRRSGAISMHDIQSILQPRDPNGSSRMGSAPCTPFDHECKPFFTPGHARRATSDTNIQVNTMPAPSMASHSRGSYIPSDLEAVPDNPPIRVRVGFAERVEYIRPLSTISSETESSMSTIRGHSVTNSISSIISAGFSGQSAHRPVMMAAISSTPDDAAAVLAVVPHDARVTHDMPFQKVGAPMGSPDLTPSSLFGAFEGQAQRAVTEEPAVKRRSFQWWDNKKTSKVRKSSLPSSVSEPHLAAPVQARSVEGMLVTVEPASGRQGLETLTENRKPRKVKSWTQTLMPKRSKGHLQQNPADDGLEMPKSPASSEAPSSPYMAFDDGKDFVPDFDADNMVTIVSGSAADDETTVCVPRPSAIRSRSQEDCASPIIDLDVAMEPFGSPTLGPRPSTSSRLRARHSLQNHVASSQGHRRTESAPELAPFDQRAAKKSPVAMEDVFEEEDEDLDGPQDLKSMAAGRTASSSLEALRATSLTPRTSRTALSSKSSVSDLGDQSPLSTGFPPSPPGLPSEYAHARRPGSHRSLAAAMVPVEIVEFHEEPRATLMKKSSEGALTPVLNAQLTKQPSPLMTLSLPSPSQVIMTPDTLSGSSMSNRGFTSSSQISLDTPRLGTATSSSTNDNRSIFFADIVTPADVRTSIDVPSLSSSRSIRSVYGPATSATAFQSGAFTSTSMARPRSAFALGDSQTAAAFPNFGSSNGNDATPVARKRSSIASLSRLVSSGFAESKSKLSMEIRPETSHSTLLSGDHSKKRTKRRSKLMQFFRSPKLDAKS